MQLIRLFLLCLAVVVCQNTVGEHLVVPGTYASIQAAIDNAVPGDSIEVQAGIYEETLLFKEGIELKGAGPDSTIVRTSTMSKAVIKVTDAASGSIAGFTFGYSDIAPGTLNVEDYPHAVEVVNSSIEIHDCILGPNAGSGIMISGKSNVRVIECRAEGNFQAGVYVKGAGAKATILHNEFHNNRWGAICLTKGAKAEAEDNMCLNNARWGALALNKDTSIVLKNNTFESNDGPGILIQNWGHGILENNRCRTNNGNGILFKLGATGKIVGNTLEKNTEHGIVVQSLAVDVEVRNNTCTGNGSNGIFIGFGAGGEVTENTCNGNRWCGILISNWFSNPVITKNVCNENGLSGITFNLGAAGKAEDNVCQNNAEVGILVKDENTKPDIGLNHYEGNKVVGFAKDPGYPVSRQYQIDIKEMGYALSEKHFDEIETMVGLLRQHKCRSSDGGWQLYYFYDGLHKGCDDVTPSQRDAFKALLERWKSAYPESITPYIVEAKVHSAYGWEARGGGYANTVTDEGWKVFREELGFAENILLEAEALNSNDPQFYATMIDICNGLNYSSQELQAFFDKAIAIDMGYFPVYYSRTWSLSRRWGGGPSELEHFAEMVVTLTEEHYGTTLYAQIAASMATHLGEDEFAEDHFFDWKRIDDGYIRLAEEFPESTFYLNQHCLLACIYHQQEKAQSLFRKIGDTHERWVWRGDSGFQAWKQWAFDMAPAPHPKAPDSLPKPIPGSALNSLLLVEMLMLLNSFPLILGALLFILLSAVVVISLLYFTRRKTRLRSPVQEDHPEDKHNEDDGSAL